MGLDLEVSKRLDKHNIQHPLGEGGGGIALPGGCFLGDGGSGMGLRGFRICQEEKEEIKHPKAEPWPEERQC